MWRYGHGAVPGIGLGRAEDQCPVDQLLELALNADGPGPELQVGTSQPGEFTEAEPGPRRQENHAPEPSVDNLRQA